MRVVTFKDVNVEELPETASSDRRGCATGARSDSRGEDLAAQLVRGAAATRSWPATGGAAMASSTWSCERAGLVVFCEVKTRTSTAFGAPAEAVTADKQRRIRRLAAQWLVANPAPCRRRAMRFDVAAVLGGNIEVIEGAF